MEFIISLAIYLFTAYCLQLIAKKTNTPNEWFAWIPFLSYYLMLKIAGKPGWWFLLLLVPIVNIISMIFVLLGIAKARKKPEWWGLLILIPVVGYALIAFTDDNNSVARQPLPQ